MKKIIVNLLLGMIVLASSWALLHAEFFRAHDYIHAARVIEMYRALQDGQFPVRWSENFGYGYGMPLFEFYAPLPYFVGALLHFFGFKVLTTVKILFLFSSLFTTWGAYKLGKKFFGEWGSILTAAAITLAPYRAVNLFVRGALSEAWGIMAMPWVLYGIIKIADREKRGWVTLTLSLVVLMLSHNIMTMLFVPLSLLFAVLFLGYRKWIVGHKKNELKVMLQIVGVFTLAVGLTSFYLFPALIEKDLTKVGAIFGGYFHYSHHFLYIRQFFQLNWGYGGSAWGPDDKMSFFLGWGQWIALGTLSVSIFNRIIRVLKNKQTNKIHNLLKEPKIFFSFAIGIPLLIALYMTLLKAKPLWDVLPGLSFAQFPWRFLGPAIIFLGLLVGLSVSFIKNKWWRTLYAVVILLLLLINAQFFKPQKFLKNADSLYYTDANLIAKEMSGVLPDYIPLQMADKLTPPTHLAWCIPEDCSQDLEIIVDKSHQNLVKTHFTQPQKLEFAVADFPGWKVELDGKKAPKQLGEVGNIMVKVPSGEHLVGVIWGQSPVRFWSDMISILSWLVFLYLALELREFSGK